MRGEWLKDKAPLSTQNKEHASNLANSTASPLLAMEGAREWGAQNLVSWGDTSCKAANDRHEGSTHRRKNLNMKNQQTLPNRDLEIFR